MLVLLNTFRIPFSITARVYNFTGTFCASACAQQLLSLQDKDVTVL